MPLDKTKFLLYTVCVRGGRLAQEATVLSPPGATTAWGLPPSQKTLTLTPIVHTRIRSRILLGPPPLAVSECSARERSGVQAKRGFFYSRRKGE